MICLLFTCPPAYLYFYFYPSTCISPQDLNGNGSATYICSIEAPENEAGDENVKLVRSCPEHCAARAMARSCTGPLMYRLARSYTINFPPRSTSPLQRYRIEVEGDRQRSFVYNDLRALYKKIVSQVQEVRLRQESRRGGVFQHRMAWASPASLFPTGLVLSPRAPMRPSLARRAPQAKFCLFSASTTPWSPRG
jgi:hypothetical protein